MIFCGGKDHGADWGVAFCRTAAVAEAIERALEQIAAERRQIERKRYQLPTLRRGRRFEIFRQEEGILLPVLGFTVFS